MEQIYRIGIDHGYGNIKTAHHIFESGVIERVKESEGQLSLLADKAMDAEKIRELRMTMKILNERGQRA